MASVHGNDHRRIFEQFDLVEEDLGWFQNKFQKMNFS